ncbi:DUF4136 domain-containing protein [Noviherbaspirillum denitrificans]|uniref:DUF4136 domain-containing protein n=1 Tax=Noviherbaspirillum denitrificans TaxID=1968433 RepID=A0A254TIL9_9BURK|nr:DUF4136 domain-containing protein [Noviherbaspirillum denitrificans]OWW22434.1 hypothetical protein AYR66_25995 [Noviherbaspirillum denitrificans]
MKALLSACILAVSTLVVGCGTIIRSDVTTFHEWPDTLADKSYVFERTKEQNDSLEYKNYENLVRHELNQLGFSEAPSGTKPALKAALSYSINGRDVREVYPVVVNPYPYWYGPAWRGYYGPFYDPFWFGPPVVEQRVSQYHLFNRQLRVTLARMSDSKKLFETTVVSEGTNGSLASVMPYMVRSAFTEFPGKNGVPRHIELKMD